MTSPRTLAALAVLVAAAACARGEPLAKSDIDAARARWSSNKLTDYRLHFTVEGDLVQQGKFTTEVRAGKVARVTRNGNAVDTRDPFYTVDGMFDFLDNELEIAREPGRYWQAAGDARVYQRAHFDPETGHTTRYLRAVTGTEHNITVDISQLERL